MPGRCQEGISLERLEILGDAVLKHLTSLYLFSRHPHAHEGVLLPCKSASHDPSHSASLTSAI